MLDEVLILRNGLRVFHRIYSDVSLENVDLTSGLIEAMNQLAKDLGEVEIKAFNTTKSNFYFNSVKGFIFIARENRNSTELIAQDAVKEILYSLASSFHAKFASLLESAKDTIIDIDKFNIFNDECDSIVKRQPNLIGFPLLFNLYNNLYILPDAQITPFQKEDRKTILEIEHKLKIYTGKSLERGLNPYSEPFVIFLPQNKKIALNIPQKLLHNGENSHFMSFITSNTNWITLFQLKPYIEQQAYHMQTMLAEYYRFVELDPYSPKIDNLVFQIDESLGKWVNLNQIVGNTNLTMFEDFLNQISQSTSNDFVIETELVMQAHLSDLVTMFSEKFSIIISSLLQNKRVVFIGDKNAVKEAITSLLILFPHPSVCFWTDFSSDHLIIGTSRENLSFYIKDSVIVDLDSFSISGDEENDFCKELLDSTLKILPSSCEQAYLSFKGRIYAIYHLIKALLELSTAKEENEEHILTLIRDYPSDALKLIVQMSNNANQVLYKTIQNVLIEKY